MSSNPDQPESSPSPDPEYPIAKPEQGQGSPELRVASLLLESKPPEEKPSPRPRLQFSLGELMLLTFITALMLSVATSGPGGTLQKLESLAGLMGLGLLAGIVVMGVFHPQSAAAIRLWWAVLVLYLVACAAAVAMMALGG